MTAISPTTNFFPTPAPFTRWLFREYPAYLRRDVPSLFVEPMAGALDIVQASSWPGEITPPRTWVTNDLDPQWDACTYLADARDPMLYAMIRKDYANGRALGATIDALITNPAFDVADEFAEVAIQQARFVALYLRLSFLEPAKRGRKAEWLRAHPPVDVLVLPRFAHRRNEKGKWGHDNVTCAWMVWRECGPEDDPDTRPRGLVFPPDRVFSELRAETPAYRARVDQLTGYSPSAKAAAKANGDDDAEES